MINALGRQTALLYDGLAGFILKTRRSFFRTGYVERFVTRKDLSIVQLYGDSMKQPRDTEKSSCHISECLLLYLVVV